MTIGAPRLVGRDAELGEIHAALDRVAESGHALHVVGDPGVGKTAVLQAAAAEAGARGFVVLLVRGTVAESQLTFAALHALLRPVLDRVHSLPTRHRLALLGAFGLADGERPERMFVALAALELIADAALAAPVLIVVDDLPWIDHSSREAIEFVARRIEHEPAVMLLSSRSAAVRADTETGAILKLDRLSDSASQQLIRDSSPSLSAVDERRILAAAAGNPLALLELPQTLGSSSRPEASPPTGFALTDRLERAFAVRSHDLRSETRSSLLVAALQDSDRVHESDDAIAQLSDGNKRTADFGDAVAAGLLSVDGQTFRFRHPLVRSAIADGASAEERRAVHVAFAASLSQDPDRSSWHRSLAATGQDAQLADELEAGAERALARGAPDVATDWYTRAAELSVDDPLRAHRLLRAAELAFELGSPELVAALMAQARQLPLDPAAYARLAGLEGAFDDGVPGDEDGVRRFTGAASSSSQSHGP